MGQSVCAFCGVTISGTAAYKDKKTGETVYVDYIKDKDAFCKEYCQHYKKK